MASAEPDISRMNKQDIYREIRQRICLLDYAPGFRLNERELALEFDISRTPMRDVFQRLEYDGLIESKHGRGTVVTTIDLDEMREIYLIRMRLMDSVGDLQPIEITDEHLEKINQVEDLCCSLIDNPDKRQFAMACIRLHTVLHNLVESAPLRKFNNILFYQSARFWFLLLDELDFEEEASALLEETKMIKRALELKDVRLVTAIHKTQLMAVISRIEQMQIDNPGFNNSDERDALVERFG